MPEEKAPSRKYFIDASFDRWLLRRNPTSTYVAIAIVSRPMYSVTRSTAPAMNIMPIVANRISA